MKQTFYRLIFVLTAVLLGSGCAHQLPLPPENRPALYTVDSVGAEKGMASAPLFVVYGSDRNYNRIGRPSARIDANGKIEIFTDSRQPAVYYEAMPFRTQKGAYVNHIYRIHFAAVPFSLIPFYLTTGNNVGLMVVITSDLSGKPLLVSTVHTCGCYLAMVPTSYLPKTAYPIDYKATTHYLFGEKVPGLLNYRSKQAPRLLVHIRPGVHRVMDMEIVDAPHLEAGYRPISMRRFDLESLEKLEVDGRSTSFFYSSGILEGFVKGAVKPWETLFMSLISFDFFVGTDKIYNPAKPTANRFYTSLVPWEQGASDMRNFPAFLAFWGWRL